MKPPSTCIVYFDGGCPVCRTEIAHYRRQVGAESITWIDASSCDPSELGPDLDRSRALGRFHVREANGALVSGAAAFVSIWRRLPTFARLAALASSRPAINLLDVGYSTFLFFRRLWRPVVNSTPASARRIGG